MRRLSARIIEGRLPGPRRCGSIHLATGTCTSFPFTAWGQSDCTLRHADDLLHLFRAPDSAFLLAESADGDSATLLELTGILQNSQTGWGCRLSAGSGPRLATQIAQQQPRANLSGLLPGLMRLDHKPTTAYGKALIR